MTHAPTRAILASVGTASRPHGLRRHHRAASRGTLADDGLRIDLDDRTIMVGDRVLDLTYLEFELLAYLVLHPRQVFTRRQLMERVWGYPEIGGGRTVDVHVARLRRKLGARHRGRLATVRRVGYKYEPHDLATTRRFIPQARTAPSYAQSHHRA